MRFKFDCLNNRFWKLKDEYAYEVSEQQSFVGSYGEQSFILDPNNPNHWISFTVYDQIIRVFYKLVKRVNGKEEITYYQKDIPREGDFMIEFELNEVDIVAKRDDSKLGKKSD